MSRSKGGEEVDIETEQGVVMGYGLIVGTEQRVYGTSLDYSIVW